jgi:hypothetical protein
VIFEVLTSLPAKITAFLGLRSAVWQIRTNALEEASMLKREVRASSGINLPA